MKPDSIPSVLAPDALIDRICAAGVLRAFVGLGLEQAGSDARGATCGDARWLAALDELANVHGHEQARLLCEASALRRAHSSAGSSSTRPATASARWRKRCRAELRAARADGLEASFLLQDCMRFPLARWRAASELASAALELGLGDEARIELAHAWRLEGRAHLAVEMLEASWPKARTGASCVRALEALACACEHVGDRSSASVHRRTARAVAASLT